MQSTGTPSKYTVTKPPHFPADGVYLESRHIKSHCWYCNKALDSHRTYCSTTCREAMYEDNDQAKQRRMILGCEC